MRFSRWAKSGVLQKAFERLAQEHLYAPLCWGLDSTSVKVHPDGCGALVGLWMAYGQRKGGHGAEALLEADTDRVWALVKTGSRR